MKTLIINGSPKLNNSNSEVLVNKLNSYLNADTIQINIKNYKEIIDVCNYETIIFVFPLYVDGIPSHLLESITNLNITENTNIYAIINCGFPEGKHTKQGLDIIKNYVSIEDIREYYNPINADDIKWCDSFNDAYLKEHQGEFIRLWASLLIRNSGIYLHAYMLNTCCFWDIGSNPDTDYAYVQTGVWSNFYNVESKDLWEKLFSFSIANKLMPRNHINGALLVWIFLMSVIFMTGELKMTSASLTVLPFIFMWLTIMIATPIAVSFRYISPMLFGLPVLFVILVLLMRNKGR